jgi:IS30 family transposase
MAHPSPLSCRTADLRRCSQVDLDRIAAAERNGRPRQILGFTTPSQARTMLLH